jgi:hypothetical protein
MRQGQQNRRGRGRGRKPQNPLARNYESNGPDVKIRGTAAHIAEKYMSLARDALASGDMITAESYLQHAEHYNRIIMAAQAQLGPQHGQQQGEGPNGGGYRPRMNPDSGDNEGLEFDAADSAGVGGKAGGGDIRSNPGREPRRHGSGGGNGREAARDANSADPAEAEGSDAPDTVS